MTRLSPTGAQPGIFRGWWVVFGVFITMTAGSGFAFYAQGVFLDAFVVEQSFSVGLAGAGTGLFFVVSGVVGYYAGGLIGRFDIRLVMVVGATVASTGILLLGRVRTPAQMFGVFMIYGGGYALSGLVPGTSLITRWFHVKRSVALSIASSGLSVGGIAITPLIAKMIDRETLAVVAPRLAIGYWLGIVPVTLLLLRPSPQAMGLQPDGVINKPGQTSPSTPIGLWFREAVRTRYFRFQSAAFVLIMGAQVGALQHVFKLTKDIVGVDGANRALIVVTFTSVVARISGGVVATRVPLARLTSVLVVVQSTGMLIIGTATTEWMILVGVVVFGSAIGNLLMLHPLLLADAFGVRDYPRIYGFGSLLMVIGVGMGPFVVGLIRDQADYTIAFMVMVAVALAGLVTFWAAGAPEPLPEPADSAA